MPTEGRSCSTLSLASGEPLYGTCGEFDRWVFVSLPEAKWHPKSVIRSEGMPTAALEPWLAEELRRGAKVSFRCYQETAAAEGSATVKLFPDNEETVDIPLASLADVLRRRFDGHAEGWRPIAGRTIFVCTNGGHDACCGAEGPALFKSLRDRIADATVFRSSHLGGHKFAPTCMAMPDGSLHGRIRGAHVRPFIEAIARHDIYAPGYRGSAWLSKDEQIATAFAAAKGWLSGPIKHVRVLEIVDEGPDRRHLHAEVSGAMRFTVPLVRRTFTGPDSCGSPAKAKERWVIVGTDGP